MSLPQGIGGDGSRQASQMSSGNWPIGRQDAKNLSRTISRIEAWNVDAEKVSWLSQNALSLDFFFFKIQTRSPFLSAQNEPCISCIQNQGVERTKPAKQISDKNLNECLLKINHVASQRHVQQSLTSFWQQSLFSFASSLWLPSSKRIVRKRYVVTDGMIISRAFIQKLCAVSASKCEHLACVNDSRFMPWTSQRRNKRQHTSTQPCVMPFVDECDTCSCACPLFWKRSFYSKYQTRHNALLFVSFYFEMLPGKNVLRPQNNIVTQNIVLVFCFIPTKRSSYFY